MSSYSYINVAATLDGQIVQGLWDGDDAIVVTQSSDSGTGMTGADGSSIFSVSASKAATISIKLQHTSPTHRLLMQKLKRQQALGANASAFPFTVIDSVSGEGGTASECYVQTAPADSKGVNAVVREWVLWTGNFTHEVPNG